MSITAMKQALEALEMLARYENPETKIQVRKPKDGGPIVTMYPHKVATDAAAVLRTAIEAVKKQEPTGKQSLQVEQEPVTCQYAVDVAMPEYRCVGKCQYTTPPAAQRQPLTDEQIELGRRVLSCSDLDLFTAGARFAEAVHGIKEKNT